MYFFCRGNRCSAHLKPHTSWKGSAAHITVCCNKLAWAIQSYWRLFSAFPSNTLQTEDQKLSQDLWEPEGEAEGKQRERQQDTEDAEVEKGKLRIKGSRGQSGQEDRGEEWREERANEIFINLSWGNLLLSMVILKSSFEKKRVDSFRRSLGRAMVSFTFWLVVTEAMDCPRKRQRASVVWYQGLSLGIPNSFRAQRTSWSRYQLSSHKAGTRGPKDAKPGWAT